MLSKKLLDDFFRYSESILYTIIALALLLTAIFLTYNLVITFFNMSDAKKFVYWVVEILDKILLMLMIIEIFYTVRVSFKSHFLCAEPFLIVALIAAIRRILIVSVETAYLHQAFTNHMIEISILGVLVFIFVVGILLLRKYPQKDASEPIK